MKDWGVFIGLASHCDADMCDMHLMTKQAVLDMCPMHLVTKLCVSSLFGMCQVPDHLPNKAGRFKGFWSFHIMVN